MQVRIFHIIIAALLFAAFTSCTSARWTVKERSAIDSSDYKVLKQDNFLETGDELTPENPVLQLDLYSKTTYEYTQRVLMQRNIQEYKLRPGFIALGLGGATMAFYAANSNVFRDGGTSKKSLTLNTVGALLAVSGFLNMKPVEEPRPTGEERYLRNTGSTIRTDTVRAGEKIDATASISVRHNGRLIFEEQNRDLSNGSLNIALGGKLNELQLSGPDPGNIAIEVNFEDSTYNYQYPIRDVLQPYARITSQLAELRNSPEEDPNNVLADLVKGSQIEIKSSENEAWYQVLYGISENFVRKEDAELVWRSTDFLEGDQVVTVPRVPFGNIDVESNIPILRGPTPSSIALIVTNENYSENLPERNYAHRDGRLIKTYLTSALGYPEENIFELKDVQNPNEIYRVLSEMRITANPNTELFLFLSGHGAVTEDRGQVPLKFLGISEDGSQPTLDLRKFFEQISTISSSKTILLADIDFSSSVTPNRFTENQAREIIESNAEPLTDNDQASLLIGTQLLYPSSLYVSSKGEDKKHHIFPYYFAKALQQRITTISEIYQYLGRNVSYTARKLYDRPQDPLLIGNTSLDLTSQ